MKNKRRADLVLAGLFIAFLGVLLLRHKWPDSTAWRFLSFIVEAALVGGIADWFAVTALFRKPLGISAHTAVIPRNRAGLVRAVANLVEEELLGPQLLQQQIRHMNLSQTIISWVERQGWNKQFGDILFNQLSRNIDETKLDKAADWVKVEFRRHLQGQSLLPVLWQLTDSLTTNGTIERWLNEFLDNMEELAGGQGVYERLVQVLNHLVQQNALAKIVGDQLIMNHIVQGAVQDGAAELQKHLLLKLRQMQSSTDPFRVILKEQILSLVMEYRVNPYKERQLISLLDEMMEGISFHELLSKSVKEAARRAITPSEPNTKSPLHHWLSIFCDSYWEVFKENQLIQTRINEFLTANLSWLLNSEHRVIGKIVEEVLGKLTDEELNHFVESKVGEDLHWIRLNGSIIGAIVGTLIFSFFNFVYDPFFTPIILKWF